ncbi:hypothetical protein ABE288_02120 [Bacillus salipaludis]|uniref:hypothetical protein n=1 Tax=Bacillus salipaludis TaxID=2547811 RepID=UPI003D25E57A
MSISYTSFLKLAAIEIRKDKKHYIVEDQASGEFYEMTEICIDAIDLISQEIPLGEIEHQLRAKYPNEDVDLIKFADQLISLNLISEINGVKIECNQREKEDLGFLWIPSKIGRIFFNQYAYFIYSLLFFVNIILLIINPSLFPHYKDLFVLDSMSLILPLLIVLRSLLVLIHELGHVIALRSYNLPAKINVGHRLFLLVLETDMSTVWKLPAKDRNKLFLAGICFDTVILFFALASQLLFAPIIGFFLSLMKIVVLDIFFRIVYQCCIYMKTDFYYLFENCSGCYNLMENAQGLLRGLLPFGKSLTPGEILFDSEKKTVIGYSILYFIGVGLTVFLYIFYFIPELFYSIQEVIPGFKTFPSNISFWDSTLFILQIALFFYLLINSWRGKYLQKSQM